MSVATSVKSTAPALRLPTHREPYYAGKWQKPATGRYVEATSPGTGESLGKNCVRGRARGAPGRNTGYKTLHVAEVFQQSKSERALPESR